MLTDPQSIFMFEENDVVIPISVIEELDKFKKDMSETGRHAREFSRILDRLRDKGSLCSGVILHEDRMDSGILYVYLDKEPLPPPYRILPIIISWLLQAPSATEGTRRSLSPRTQTLESKQTLSGSKHKTSSATKSMCPIFIRVSALSR
jgi:hypothetical protein